MAKCLLVQYSIFNSKNVCIRALHNMDSCVWRLLLSEARSIIRAGVIEMRLAAWLQ